MSLPLHAQVSALLDDTTAAYEGRPEVERLRVARARMDEPLRVAIAGKVKSGKSTLLNALVGERLAPTDAGECTRIVTWYTDSHTSRVTLEPRQGQPRQVPFVRNGTLEVSLAGMAAHDVARLVVEWPSQSLQGTTLIDTPGIDSLDAATSDVTHAFLTPDEDLDTPADAVIYLMRHLHASDVRFLEAFHDQEVAQATSINAIAVLSRADEIGVGRIDAMETADRIAGRYRSDPRLGRLCQTVVPVAGLLAESATTLRQDEFRAFQLLASAPGDETERLLLSVDRFADLRSEVALDTESRRVLLERFGVFGIRLAIALVRDGVATTGPQLAEELLRRSGVPELRRVLGAQFTARRDALKARAGLAAVDAVLRQSRAPGHDRLTAELERIEAGAHELVELRLLNAIHAGRADLQNPAAAGRLLGAVGTDPASRLGLDMNASVEEVRTAARDAVVVWRGRAEHPLASRDAVQAATVLVRTCEGILADIASQAVV